MFQPRTDWVHRYNDGGLEGLSDRRGSGPPARLSPEQRAELVLIVEA
ncbi:helix-turn-helix domain-containing protein, partial [Jannaschia formosa]